MEFANGDRLISTINHSRHEGVTTPEDTPPQNTEKKDPPTTNFFDTLNWEEENAPLALDSEESDNDFNIHAIINNNGETTMPGKREDSMDDEFTAFTSGRTLSNTDAYSHHIQAEVRVH